MFNNLSYAHNNSRSILSLQDIQNHSAILTVEADIIDIAQVMAIDNNQDGDITWKELKDKQSGVQNYLISNLNLISQDTNCQVQETELLKGIRHRETSVYAVFEFAVSCSKKIDALSIDFTLFRNIDPGHRAVLSVFTQNNESLLVIKQGMNAIPLKNISHSKVFRDFGFEGIVHILKGYDHIAFLLVLLLPLARMRGVKTQFLRAAGIVTAFTLAHSITLTLASTGYISLPSKPVELTIACSVVFAALLNIIKPKAKFGWLLAFAFGLIHGFGFAGALAYLTSSQGIQFIGLVAFNLGVEAGQLAIVCLVFPLLVFISKREALSQKFVPLASLCIAVLGVIWVIERIGS